jgi:hypothetical protein
MNRSALALLCAAGLAACGDLGGVRTGGYLAVSPLLDSLFVGDQALPHQVTFIDLNGNPAPAGTVVWSSADSSIARIDATGRVTARKRGAVLIIAQAQGIASSALVVVSDTLDITLLLDTVYVMPNDTLTVPVVVLKRSSSPAVVSFEAPSNPSYSIDAASGKITATLTAGGPFPYIVHADALADTGAVEVVSLTDTTGGKFFYSVRGTAISHVGGPVVAMNYVASNGKQAFQLRGTFGSVSSPSQVVQITNPDSVIAPGLYTIDSLNPAEDVASVVPPAVCSAPRSWALWAARPAGIFAYSRRGGELGITRIVAITNGQAMSGHFKYSAQRRDYYTDPLAVLSIYGSFVAPLVSSTAMCR